PIWRKPTSSWEGSIERVGRCSPNFYRKSLPQSEPRFPHILGWNPGLCTYRQDLLFLLPKISLSETFTPARLIQDPFVTINKLENCRIGLFSNRCLMVVAGAIFLRRSAYFLSTNSIGIVFNCFKHKRIIV